MEHAKVRAAQAAAAAGMDGGRVYDAMSAQQTAHFQGQYLMQVGRAQQALANGDVDGMKQYLKNANYYLPNGQDIKFHALGDLTDSQQEAVKKVMPDIDSKTPLVANPFYGMAGHQNEPQYMPLNSLSLGQFAQAAMDPRAFQQGQMDMLKLGREYEVNMAKAHAAQTLAQGRLLWGQAALGNMWTNQAKAPGQILDEKTKADLQESQAAYWKNRATGTGGGVKIKPSDVERAQEDGGKAFDDAAQGPMVTTPALIPNPDPAMRKTQPMVPNPHGNQPMHDATKVSPLYQGLSAQDRNDGKALAGEIHAANMNMSPQASADFAAREVSARKPKPDGQPQTHINPQNGKPEKNVVDYQAKGPDGKEYPAVRVWANGHYLIRWATPNVDQSGGESPSAIPSGPTGSTGGTADVPDTPEETAVSSGQ